MPPAPPMSGDMSQTGDIHMMLGEMRGQMREVIHTSNNTAGKVDALTREVVEIKGMTATVAGHEVRLTALETEKSRREGALSLGEWIIRIVPWLIGGASFAVIAKLIGVGL